MKLDRALEGEEKRDRIQRPGATARVKARVVEKGRARTKPDRVAVEEPLEIRLVAGGETRTAAVTMRTPGGDFELAAGWLYSEGVVRERSDIERIAYCVDREIGEEQRYNILNVQLRGAVPADFASLERHFFTTSACGVCGKAGLEQLKLRGCPEPADGPRLTAEILNELPGRLRTAQGVFEATGGLHAAGLFDGDAELIALREDVGRHNALDKLVGWALMEGRVPLSDAIVLVSGRASFELAQKCVAAGVPVMCSVSAPSSLAVEVAQEFGMTLVGFLRDERFNVYSGQERIEL